MFEGNGSMDETGVSPNGNEASVAANDRPTTTIWDELNSWGKSIATWQRYIISHAVRDGELSDDRIGGVTSRYVP